MKILLKNKMTLNHPLDWMINLNIFNLFLFWTIIMSLLFNILNYISKKIKGIKKK